MKDAVMYWHCVGVRLKIVIGAENKQIYSILYIIWKQNS